MMTGAERETTRSETLECAEGDRDHFGVFRQDGK